MERLTYSKDGYWRVNFSGVQYQADFVDRLAAYEDTGLTPEEIKAPFTEDTMINLAAQALGVEPSRIREIAEADKDGRVVVLPCIKLPHPRRHVRHALKPQPAHSVAPSVARSASMQV